MIFYYLSTGYKGLANPAIPAAETGGDEIGDATALEEGRDLGSTVELVDVLDHLHETDPDDSGLGVVAELETTDKTSGTGHDVLIKRRIRLIIELKGN